MEKSIVRSLALFCGSTDGNGTRYRQVAADLGSACAQRGVTLYYGGAKVGLMYAAAAAALADGGKVVGIIPDFFSSQAVVAEDLTEQIVVKSMSERKQKMEQVADAFVVLPGSFGTMDEFFEVLTDAQLGFHSKPIVVLNAFGYYDFLQQQINLFKQEGFLRPFHYDLVRFATTVEEVFTQMAAYAYPNDPEWMRTYMK